MAGTLWPDSLEDAARGNLRHALRRIRNAVPAKPGVKVREHMSSTFEHLMVRLLLLLPEQGRWPELLDWAGRWIKLGQKTETPIVP